MMMVQGLYLIHNGLLALVILSLVIIFGRVQLSNRWMVFTVTIIIVFCFYVTYYFELYAYLPILLVLILILFVYQSETLQLNSFVQLIRILFIVSLVISMEQLINIGLDKGLSNSITGVANQFFGLVIILDIIKLVIVWLIMKGRLIDKVKSLMEKLPIIIQLVGALTLLLAVSLWYEPIRYGRFIVGFLPTDSVYFYQFLLLGIFLIFGLQYFVSWLKRQQRLRVQEENLRQYNKNIEHLYNQLTLFRHDYLNILYSMRLSIEQDDMNSVRRIFTETVEPTQKIIQSDEFELGKLGRVESIELKSILYTKLVEAQSKGIRIGVDIGEVNWDIPISSMMLVRLLSILLDNAIQAAKEAEDEYVAIGIQRLDKQFVFNVTNSYNELGGLLKEPNAPSKQVVNSLTQPKNGHGLYYIRQAVSENPQLRLQTEVTPDEVNQYLIIQDK